MSREIKFRAWDKFCNKIFRVQAIEFIDKIEGHTGVNCYTDLDNSNNDHWISSENLSLMQYTGLKDKNNKDIYVRDILSDKWKVEVYQNNEGTYMIRFHNTPAINKPMSLLNYLKKRERAGTSDRDCVVIGNIYENPELFKQ